MQRKRGSSPTSVEERVSEVATKLVWLECENTARVSHKPSTQRIPNERLSCPILPFSWKISVKGCFPILILSRNLPQNHFSNSVTPKDPKRPPEFKRRGLRGRRCHPRSTDEVTFTHRRRRLRLRSSHLPTLSYSIRQD